MAMFSWLRSIALRRYEARRHFSSILNPNSNVALSSTEKTLAAISLIKAETNPERIIPLCRAAELTPAARLDRIAFSVAVDKFLELNYPTGVRSYIEELKRWRFDLRTERFHSMAIILYGRAGMLGEAIRTFKEFEKHNISPSCRSLNALLLSCLIAKDYSELRRIFAEFPEHYGVKPNLKTYNVMIKGFIESGSSASVYSIIAEMESRNLKPNLTSFGYLLAGIFNEGKHDEVDKVFKLMKSHGWPRGFKTYNFSIRVLCSYHKPSEAKALFDLMVSKHREPNAGTYILLSQGFCEVGNVDGAKEVLKCMKTAGFKPGKDCFMILQKFCQLGELDAALEICREIVADGYFLKFRVVKSLVDGLSGVSRTEEAKEFLQELMGKFRVTKDRWKEMEAALSG